MSEPSQDRLRAKDRDGNTLSIGDMVTVVDDNDGARASTGTVKTIFRSGRCSVTLDIGGFRNLPGNCLRKL